MLFQYSEFHASYQDNHQLNNTNNGIKIEKIEKT